METIATVTLTELTAKQAARRLVDERLNRETHQISIRVSKPLHDSFLEFQEANPDLNLTWKNMMTAMMEEFLSYGATHEAVVARVKGSTANE